MADTTTIGTQGFFGTVTDRIASIGTQGYFLELEDVTPVRIFVNDLAEKYSITALKDKYLISFLPEKHSISKLDNE